MSLDRRREAGGARGAGVEFLLHEAGEVGEHLDHRFGELPRARVHHAERAEATAVLGEEREAGVEADAGFAGDERVVGEAVV